MINSRFLRVYYKKKKQKKDKHDACTTLRSRPLLATLCDSVMCTRKKKKKIVISARDKLVLQFALTKRPIEVYRRRKISVHECDN
jgi:hypothetical protein